MRLVLAFALTIFGLAACTLPQTGEAPATSTPSSGLTSVVPPVPGFDVTPVCFVEPDSDAALQAAQTRIGALIPGTRIIWYDNFDCEQLDEGWSVGQTNPTLSVSVAAGTVTLRAQNVENIWEGMGRSTANLEVGKGMMVLFQYEAGSSAPLFIYSGEWQSQNYLRSGLTINNESETVWQIWEAFAFLSYPVTVNVLRPDTEFYLRIILGTDGRVFMKVWEKNNPNNEARFQDRIPGASSGRLWASIFQVQEGALRIDEYVEFSFATP